MLNRELMSPKSIVVVGGSQSTTTPGGKILQNILSAGFAGDLLVVNPKAAGEKIQGVQVYAHVNDIPGAELAIIAIAAKFVKESVAILAEKKGARAFIILSAGFSEMGEEGRQLEREIVAIVNSVGGALIGPNCIGILTPTYAGIFAGPIPKLNSKGCDFVSGSGATAAFMIERGISMGLSFASLFSVGNGAQIGVEDVIKAWDEQFNLETSSKVKLIYMENVQRPEMLLKHASSLVRKGCKIAAVKSGQSEIGERAASSHTGALANSEVAVDALLRKAGIVRCSGREELLTTAAVFCDEMVNKLHIANTNKDSSKTNLAIITHAGGPGVMLADALASGGIGVPMIKGERAQALLSQLFPGSTVQNPIDFLATGTPEQLEKIIDFIESNQDQETSDIHGMVIIFGHTGMAEVKPVYELIHRKMSECKKPIWVVMPSVTTGAADIEHFKSLGRIYFEDEVVLGRILSSVVNTPKPASASALASVETITASGGRESGVNVEKIRHIMQGQDVQELIKNGDYLPPRTLQALLDAAGITRVGEEVVTSVPAALSVFTKFTSGRGEKASCVMKVVGPIHKTEVGGVVLDVQSPQEIQQHFTRLMGIEGAMGVLMQPMLKGIELFLGAKREGHFGHTILCGLGGILVEVLKDVASGLAPLDKSEALQMIKSLKGYKIIQGVRGKAGANEELFADLMVKLSFLVSIAPEIMEIDLNPLVGTPSEIAAVDARVRVCLNSKSGEKHHE
ncbi:MAG: acetate--CoA ligase family protein [Oligoflexia bacterium]|nr:acetate--CoA ligase family protein [Oligoflexia bacterium]